MPGNFKNTLYPPQVNTFQPAFAVDSPVKIYFSLSPYNSSINMKTAKVHIAVTKQSNNENAFKDNPTGIKITTQVPYDDTRGLHYVVLNNENEQDIEFDINQMYKVQLRLDISDQTVDMSSSSNIALYLLENQEDFSEWSSVTLIRPIAKPVIMLREFDTDSQKPPSFNRGIIPVSGKMYFGNGDTAETETLQSYQIDIFDSTMTEPPLLSSPVVYTGNNINPNDIYYRIDLQGIDKLTENTKLKLHIKATTKNQYYYEKVWDFNLSEYISEDSFDPIFTMSCDNENGIITLHLKNTKEIYGTLYIKRASSFSDYKDWEDLRVIHVKGSVELDIKDNTVGSLAWYSYSAQLENISGGLSQVEYAVDVEDKASRKICPQFYDAILTRNIELSDPAKANALRQFKIKYNYNISSMKPVVNRAKIDTIGGKYPKFAQNAILNYKQFSISGLITAMSDENEMLMTQRGYFGEDDYKNYLKASEARHLILTDVEKDENGRTIYNPDGTPKYKQDINGNLHQEVYYQEWAYKPKAGQFDIDEPIYVTKEAHDGNDYWWEREFREKAIEWLNDGEPKLYRSMTEGNMAVMLTDISLTPNATLGRRIWNFSATMYEVGDGNSLDTLNEYGIYHVPHVDPLSNNEDSNNTDDYQDKTIPGQLYTLEVTDRNDIIQNLISNTMNERYAGILRTSLPQDCVLRNVKITFHSNPNMYLQNGNNMIEVLNPSGLSEEQRNRVQLGYLVTVRVSGSGRYNTIFVNEKGYYQIPNKLSIDSLSFSHIGDVVTIDYILDYKARNNKAYVHHSVMIDKIVVGQEHRIFKPDQYMGEIIRRKYNFVKTDSYSEQMKYWKGICVDVDPFAIFNLQYEGEDSMSEYVVGATGVYHLLKDTKVQDLCFKGRRMVEVELEGNTIEEKTDDWLDKVRYLEEWEYILDPTQQIYTTTNNVQVLFLNTVYNINGSLKIYYRQKWYDFKPANNHTGRAIVPIEGQLNYYGDVVKSEY